MLGLEKEELWLAGACLFLLWLRGWVLEGSASLADVLWSPKAQTNEEGV